MHRAQILLDDWQFAALKARAEREGRSISDVVRQCVSAQMGQPQAGKNEHAAIAGIGEDAAYGREHDQFLYGKPADKAGRRKAGPSLAGRGNADSTSSGK